MAERLNDDRVPPFSAQSIDNQQRAVRRYEPIGALLGSSFKLVTSNLKACLLLTFPVLMIFSVLPRWIPPFWAYTAESGQLARVVFYVSELLEVLGYFGLFFALSFHLYWSGRGFRISTLDSLQRGFGQVGRYILYLVAFAVVRFFSFGFIWRTLVAVVEWIYGVDWFYSPLLLTFGDLVTSIFWLVALAIGVKLVFFVMAAAVGPTGESPLRTSWKLTDGRFGSTLIRLLVLAAIGLVFNLAVVGIVIVVISSNLTTVEPFYFSVFDYPDYNEPPLIALNFFLQLISLMVSFGLTTFGTSVIVTMYSNIGGPAMTTPNNDA